MISLRNLAAASLSNLGFPYLKYQSIPFNSLNDGWFVVFNATFNNTSAISWRSVLLVEETRVPTDLLQVTDKLYHIPRLSSIRIHKISSDRY